ncbi:MAG: chorismate mutase [Ruminococcaceae bacterium]|nr:chorismate mutase [Oscillospiraceae bacterium]
MNMDIQESRSKIDAIDKELVKLFCERMEVVKEVAAYKKENGVPVFDRERERTLLDSIEEMAGEDYGDMTRRLYGSLLELSRMFQSKMLFGQSHLSEAIERAIEETPALFPEKAIVACQGVEGAHSAHACEKIFEKPSIMYLKSFEAVFQAVSNGLCQYGVVPLENSSAGSVNQIYSLMSQYNFNIVRSTKMHIEHSLVANEGATIDSILEVYSHPQAISQCSDFLSGLSKNVKIIPCDNTALAAKKVADSKSKSIAAICSADCSNQYGLEILQNKVQNSANNYTRFICFSKKLEIYPGADKTSLLLKVPHRAGALYNIMAIFYAFGINILKLESRPIPESDFEFMFYFDLDVPVYSNKLTLAIDQLVQSLGTKQIKYLGSYREA